MWNCPEMMSQIYVSLDLETTGLDPESDAIIEVAAVKFDSTGVLDTFHSLVNPLRPLPYRIRMLTGIGQAEVAAAPPFTAIALKLLAFVGSYPIVGHNIAFDLDFLSRQHISPDNPSYDTYELATIFLPRLDDYSLASVARTLETKHRPQHRALSDAQAAREVFLALVDRALGLDLSLISEINRLGAATGWSLRQFFLDIEKGKARMAFSSPRKIEADTSPGMLVRERAEPLVPRSTREPLDIEQLSEILGETGALGCSFPQYEHRPEQIEMMQAVAQAFNASRHLIVEAGTGTGKSVAYLLPAILYSLKNSAPVVVSTNTINLQEQLTGKDIPSLLKALGLSGETFRAVQLKGRSNYLCRRRWNSWRQSGMMTAEEMRTCARLLIWLSSTTSGDRAEVNPSPPELALWSRICAETENCLAGGCLHYRQGICFFRRARDAAERAHLITVNHALLLSELASGSRVLPEYHHLIVDEAHHLEDEASEQFGFDLSQRDILSHLARVSEMPGSGRSGGFLTQLESAWRQNQLPPATQSRLEELCASIRSQVGKAAERVFQFYDALWDLLQRYSTDTNEYEQRLRLTRATRAQPAWSAIELAADNLSSALRDGREGLGKLYNALEVLPDAGLHDPGSLLVELSSLIRSSQELGDRLNSTVFQPEPDKVYWASLASRQEIASLHAAPLYVSKLLDDLLFSTKDTVVFTGATLSTESSFLYLRERLGIGEAEERLLGSPFNYLHSTMIYLPNDIPHPNQVGYSEGVEKVILESCRATGGRTLVLFTSYSALRDIYAAIRDPLEQEQIMVLGQGIDGSPRRLLSLFKTMSRAVLLGTASFWEGVDVPGEALSVLVITRLPFSVPTDPVFEARAETFDDPFNEYTLPQAVIKFKQGFGRLIRSKSDRGVIAVLDRRLQTKSYGKAFLHSLPPCTIKVGPSRALPAEIMGWLEGRSPGAKAKSSI